MYFVPPMLNLLKLVKVIAAFVDPDAAGVQGIVDDRRPAKASQTRPCGAARSDLVSGQRASRRRGMAPHDERARAMSHCFM
jgi:hypothetical protein